MVKLTSFLTLALLTVSANAKLCTKSDTRFVGQKAALTQTAQSFANTTFTVSGTAEIIDGCSFVVRNFTYRPEFAGTVWYGRRGNDGATGIRVSQEGVGANNGTTDSGVFNMVTTVGAAASFEDFDTLVLFVPGSNYELGVARFAGLVATTTSTTPTTSSSSSSSTAAARITPNAVATTTSSPTKTTQAATTTQAASGGEKVGFGGMAAAGLAAAAVAAIGL